jgi:ubiquitin-conjugating enzyme E2 Q
VTSDFEWRSDSYGRNRVCAVAGGEQKTRPTRQPLLATLTFIVTHEQPLTRMLLQKAAPLAVPRERGVPVVIVTMNNNRLMNHQISFDMSAAPVVVVVEERQQRQAPSPMRAAPRVISTTSPSAPSVDDDNRPVVLETLEAVVQQQPALVVGEDGDVGVRSNSIVNAGASGVDSAAVLVESTLGSEECKPSSMSFPEREEEDPEEEVDEEDEYEYEDDDDAPFVSGFLEVTHPVLLNVESPEQQQQPATLQEHAPATIRDDEEEEDDAKKTRKWQEPSRAAVEMSVRMEKEKSGNKRRLLQDLYRIMNQPSEHQTAAGFSLRPTNEDSMKEWTIRLFQFDADSNLAKDLLVLGLEHVQLSMIFPDDYPFAPPFVRVVQPRFKRQTGFVMSGALCMELLTSDGWNPVNDIESVIVSIRSLLVVGDGRLEAACSLPASKYAKLLRVGKQQQRLSSTDRGCLDQKQPAKKREGPDDSLPPAKRRRTKQGEADVNPAEDDEDDDLVIDLAAVQEQRALAMNCPAYTIAEAEGAYKHLSDYHQKKGWDTSGWWAKKG